MYRRLGELFQKKISGKILSISELGDMSFLVDLSKSDVIEAYYPEFDMQKLPFDKEVFDYVISDQVIEHIENPFSAIAESYRVLKKGGIAIHTTCFINYFHPSPKDYWRFSPDALKFLCKDFKEILQCEGWGNRFAILSCFLGDRLRAMQIPNHKWSLRHLLATFKENRYYISTWIVAKK